LPAIAPRALERHHTRAEHQRSWSRVPLSAGEVALDAVLRHAGHSRTLADKTHVMSDLNGLARLKLNGTDLAEVLRRGGS
jgi:hypothetical protein